MNERIKELVKQATLPGYMLGESYVTSRLDEQKFAELIVKECMKVAVFKDDGTVATAQVAGYMAAGRSTAAQMIREHFGVEE